MSPKNSTKPKRKADEPPAEERDEKTQKIDDKAIPKDPVETIKWLLSDKSLDLITDEEVGQAGQRSYRSAPGELTPFEELICAMLLAKPISHRLGLRSIRTVLNEPHMFVTPGKVIDAGVEKLYEALSDAKTQHKDKTADQLFKMANVMIDEFGEGREDTGLAKIREQAGRDPKKERELLRKSIKGIGGMAIDLLYRRLQASWPELYPFADKRTLQALAAFNMPAGSAKELADYLEKQDLGDSRRGAGASNKAATFALLLDRAIAIHLDEKGGRILNGGPSK